MGSVLDKASDTSGPMPAEKRPNFDVLVELQKNAQVRTPSQAVAPFFDFDQKGIRDLLVTDTRGAICATLPVSGEIPVLKAGGDTKGCGYTDAQTDPHTFEMYHDHKDQTVKVYTDGPNDGQGSGVMVAKNGDQCLILTANHVIQGKSLGQSLPRLHIATADGVPFPAKIGDIDATNDLATLSVDMGSSAEALCKPVAIAKVDHLATFEDTVNLGYPGFSKSVYASPSSSLGTRRLRDMFGEAPFLSDFLPGENPDRPVLEQEGLAIPGNSGGPTFNANGELVGVVDGGSSHYSVFSTPVDADTINGMTR